LSGPSRVPEGDSHGRGKCCSGPRPSKQVLCRHGTGRPEVHRHPGPVLRHAVAVRVSPGTSPVTAPAATPSRGW
jgi:hypothetical protein